MSKLKKTTARSGSLVMPASRTLIKSSTNLLMFPFIIVGEIVSTILSFFIPRGYGYRRTGIFSIFFSLAKLCALVFLGLLIFNPQLLAQMDPQTRNILGIVAVAGGIIGILGSVSGLFGVALLCCFWFIATIYLAQTVLGTSLISKTRAPKSMPQTLPGGLKYQEIPEHSGQLGEKLVSYDEGSSWDFSKYNPLNLIGGAYNKVETNVAEGASSISNSVSSSVASSVQSVSDAVGLGDTSSLMPRSFGSAGSGALPEGAYFPRMGSHKGSYYPTRKGKNKNPVSNFIDDVLKNF